MEIKSNADGSKVAIVGCDSYDFQKVLSSVRRGFELIEASHPLFSSGEKIVLKPNMLASDSPDHATTTHPSVFGAVAEVLLEKGVKLFYGDSPAFHRVGLVAKKTRIETIADKLGVELADFENSVRVYYKHARQNRIFNIAKGLGGVNGIISLPKLKTHGYTIFTGAVKNQFGCIPGLEKSSLHFKINDLEQFSQMLVDLNMLLKPRLYIMDGIVGMEGNGPRRGNPVHLGILLFSTDPVALDSVASKLVGINPYSVPTSIKGMESGLGYIDDITIVGDKVDFPLKRFSLPRYRGNLNLIPAPVREFIRNRLTPYPAVDYSKCIKCYECHKVCPAVPKAMEIRDDGFVASNYRVCIRCYCCQEICPAGAIKLKLKIF